MASWNVALMSALCRAWVWVWVLGGQLTDPLDPVYDVNGLHIADDPIHSKPKKLSKRKNAPFFPLVTEDIEVRARLELVS